MANLTRNALRLLALLLALVPGLSLAAFGDCADPEYRAHFDSRLRTIDYDCVEHARIDVASDFGHHQIRIVHDLSADWAVDAGLLAEIERGVRQAVAGLGRVGRFEIVDTTILVADDMPPDATAESVGGIAAITRYGGDPGECQVTFYALGPGADPSYAAAVAAHEIFHCVQRSTFDPNILAALGRPGGPAWWLEGSADWFASMALPDPAYFQRRVDDFDAASPTTALTRMTYETLVFFLWLAEQRGEAGMVSFLASLSQEPGDGPQQAALAAALPEAQWIAFAQAYLEGDIRRPAGGLTVRPREGETWTWEETRTRTVRLEPFVLTRARVALGCGDWNLRAEPERWHGTRAEYGADWGPFPPDLDTQAGDPDVWVFAALLADIRPQDLRLRFDQASGCGGCAGSVRTDSCLVGQWQLSSGGAAQWMRENLPPGVSLPRVDTRGEVLVLEANGRYRAGTMSGSATILARGRDGTARADGQLSAQASGQWSAEGGRLNLCPESGGMSGSARITQPSGPPMSLGVGAGPGGPMSLPYTCSDGALQTQTPIPGMPPMRSGYTRIDAGDDAD